MVFRGQTCKQCWDGKCPNDAQDPPPPGVLQTVVGLVSTGELVVRLSQLVFRRFQPSCFWFQSRCLKVPASFMFKSRVPASFVWVNRLTPPTKNPPLNWFLTLLTFIQSTNLAQGHLYSSHNPSHVLTVKRPCGSALQEQRDQYNNQGPPQSHQSI